MPSATTPARSGCLHVEAITCDMNADFERASLKRCPHIVYEYFHLVKNFNEKVISDVKKDEQVRLKGRGRRRGSQGPQALQVHPHVLRGHQGQRRA